MGLTDQQERLLVGTLLGDGCLELNGNHVRLRITHSLKQKGYLFWKYSRLENLCPSEPRLAKSWHSKAQRFYERYEFSTFSIPLLRRFWEMFYTPRGKVVPDSIMTVLDDPLTLAVWYMDDGYKRNDCNAVRFSTDCFSVTEQRLLQRCLKDNFGLETSLHRKGSTWNIYIPSSQTGEFRRIVEPHIHPSLRYKLPLAP